MKIVGRPEQIPATDPQPVEASTDARDDVDLDVVPRDGHDLKCVAIAHPGRVVIARSGRSRNGGR